MRFAGVLAAVIVVCWACLASAEKSTLATNLLADSRSFVVEREAAPILRKGLRLSQVWHQCQSDSACGVGYRCCLYSSGNRCVANTSMC